MVQILVFHGIFTAHIEQGGSILEIPEYCEHLRISIKSEGGSVNPRIVKTGSDGLVTVTVAPGMDESVYVIEAVAGDAVGRVNVRVLSGD